MRNFICNFILLNGLILYSNFVLAQDRDNTKFKYKYYFTTDTDKPKENIIKITKSKSDTSQVCFSVKNNLGFSFPNFELLFYKHKSSSRNEKENPIYVMYLKNDSIKPSIISNGIYDIQPLTVGFGRFKLKLRKNQMAFIQITARYIGPSLHTIHSNAKLHKRTVKLIKDYIKVNGWNSDVKQFCGDCVVSVTEY